TGPNTRGARRPVGERADARPHRDPDPEAVLLREVQPRIRKRHFRRGDSHLREARHPLGGFALQIILGVEGVDLTRELGREPVAWEALDRARAAAAFDEAMPVLLDILAQGVDGTHPGHNHAGATVFGGRPRMVGTY